MTSALESVYIKPERPYSQHELQDMRTKFSERNYISDVFAHHDKCSHFYRVKKNGKKFNNIISENDPGNCTVCWKLSKTPHHLYDNAMDLVFLYEKTFKDPVDRMFYDDVDIETCFYTWIYEQH